MSLSNVKTLFYDFIKYYNLFIAWKKTSSRLENHILKNDLNFSLL